MAYQFQKTPDGKYKLTKKQKSATKEVGPDEIAQKAIEQAKKQC